MRTHLPKGHIESVPLESLSPTILNSATALSTALQPLRVLVVDDDRKIADTLVRVLETHGYEAEAVYSGRQGVERAWSLRPGIVISDVGMPDMDGISMVDAIGEFLPATQIVMICEQLPRKLAIPGWTVIKKPVQAVDLLAVIGRAMQAQA